MSAPAVAPVVDETAAQFAIAQSVVNDALKELLDGPHAAVLADFRLEFEALAAHANGAHEGEVRMKKKCTELRAEATNLRGRVAISEKEGEEASALKLRLEGEIEDTWARVSESHTREAEKRIKSAEYKTQIQELHAGLGTGSGWSEEQEATMKTLQAQRTDVERDADAKMATVTALKTEVQFIYAELEGEERTNLELQAEIEKLQAEVDAKVALTELHLGKKEREEQRLVQMKERVEVLTVEADDKSGALEKGDKEIAAIEGRLREAKAQMEKYLREYDGLFRKTHKLTEELDEQMQRNQLAQAECVQREQDVQQKRGENVQVSKELARVAKLRDATVKKIAVIEAKKEKVEREREALKAELKQLTEFAVVTERKEGESLRKQIDSLAREREILNKKIIKAGERAKATYDLGKIQENTRKNLENEIAGFKTGVQQQRDMVQQLVQDRERYETEADAANQKFYTSLEELKLQELQITALQKKITEGETRLKQQQNLYEQVRSDRNLYSKQLIESQDEIVGMRRKFKIMNHQIEQLKEEITGKDQRLVREHFEHHKVDKEKEALKNELTRIKKQIQSSEQIIANQEAEVQKLTAIIAEADAERSRQVKECDAVESEKKLLGAQLERRKEELRKLYEKIKVNKSLLEKGVAAYDDRVAQIALLNERIKEMGAEGSVSDAQVQNMHDLRNEVYRLQRELLQERTKIKALSEELERPLNVHRWRKLEGSDPQRYDQIRKVQALQKTLIEKTDEVVEKDLLIQEKEKLYIELKQILARQPGQEVAEQLVVYQQNLKEKQRQMKAMESELQMYKSQLSEYKHEIETLNGGMERAKQQWFDNMREAEAAELAGGIIEDDEVQVDDSGGGDDMGTFASGKDIGMSNGGADEGSVAGLAIGGQ